MHVESQKLSEFFNIGRDLGWDVERQKWTVNSLIDPEGRSYRLGEILEDGLPLDLPLVKSGNRYGYPPLRDLIVASQRYDVSRDNVLVTLGTQLSNFLALAVLLEPGDEAIIDSPSWEQPRVLSEALHANYRLIRRRQELNWGIDLDELVGLITPKTKLIYLCQPNWPSASWRLAMESTSSRTRSTVGWSGAGPSLRRLSISTNAAFPPAASPRRWG
jgi:histidinol-phosphate/aromatic aminotransferase/cobyric acid decarboxylase-like protein